MLFRSAVAMPPCDRVLDGGGLNDELPARQSQRADGDPTHAVDQNLGCEQAVGNTNGISI